MRTDDEPAQQRDDVLPPNAPAALVLSASRASREEIQS